MMHTKSPNPSGRPRFLTNGNVRLLRPMRFQRSGKPGDTYSLVELATLRALGQDSGFSFAPQECWRAPEGLGNGLWPLTPPPERTEKEARLHQLAAAQDVEQLVQISQSARI